MDTLLAQQCAEPELLLAVLDFLSSLGKIFIPAENQVVKPDLSPLCISSLSLKHSGLLIFDERAALNVSFFDVDFV